MTRCLLAIALPALLALGALGGAPAALAAQAPDLQVVDGNPLESFKPLGHPSLVMIGGAVRRSHGARVQD